MEDVNDTGGIAARLDEQASYHRKLLRVLHDWRQAIIVRNWEHLELLAEKLQANGVALTEPVGSHELSAMLEHYGIEPLIDPEIVDRELTEDDIPPFFRVYREMELEYEFSLERLRTKMAEDVASKNHDLRSALHDALIQEGWDVTFESLEGWSDGFTNALLAGHGFGPLLQTEMLAGVLVATRDGRIIKSRQRPEWE